jgi:hypothetical protein
LNRIRGALSSRSTAWVALGLGLLFTLGYFAWVLTRRYDAGEFGYAPFGPEPLPYSPMRGFTYEQLWSHVARAGLLAPGLLLVSLGLTALRPLLFRTSSRRVLAWAVTVSLGVTAYVMLVVLRGRPTSDDELVYRMQASFYLEGRLTGLDVGLLPPDVFSVQTLLGYTGKYLPGEGIVQMLGVLAGIPQLTHLPLLALTLYAWHRQLTLGHSRRFADFATVALAISPMVMLTAATGLSETTSLCAVVLAGLGLEWARGTRPIAGAVLTGAAVGFGMLTRPQTLFPVGLVLVPWLAVVLWRRRGFAALGVLALVLSAGAFALGTYNYALSGSPLKVPWFLTCAIEHYGFGRVWAYDTFEHTPLTALENIAVVLVRLNSWWLGLPCSLVVLVLARWLRLPLGRFRVWWGVTLAIVLFEAGYYSPGASDTGTLYHHELVLPGSLVAASAAEALLARFPRFFPTALALHLGLGTLGFTAEQAARLGRMMTHLHADSDAALAKLETPALLFHETRGSEVRIVAGVFDSFPRRLRAARDPVVTFPNLPVDRRARIQRAYPGRRCYYYRRNPETEAAEVHRCEDAAALMNQRFRNDEPRPIWIPPTAYELTSFDPFEANRARRVRDQRGHPLLGCCGLRAALALGAELHPNAFDRCSNEF